MTEAKILIVDDDEAIRKSLQDALEVEGFKVITANDGVTGLVDALNEKPQLIVTDVKMPLLTGMGMLEELRKSDDWGAKVPLIVLTNFDTDENIMQNVMKYEPSYYFLKSKTSPSKIVDAIKEKLAGGTPDKKN